MHTNSETDRLHARIEALEQQVADLQKALDELVPQYKELAHYVADLRARLHEVEDNVEHLVWKSAA